MDTLPKVGMQSFNVTFWLGSKVEVFDSLNGELQKLVWQWMHDRAIESKPWVTGRVLFGTEAFIHPGTEPEGGHHILQFCGDIPPQNAVEPTILIETLTALAGCILTKLDLSYARIRIGATTLEDLHVQKSKSESIPTETVTTTTEVSTAPVS
jgi:hypothetical protein